MKEFKLIVAGGRDYMDYEHLSRVLFAMADNEFADIKVSIVSGMAKGADALGVRFAREYGIKLYEFPADWNTHGKSAGFRRNQEMARFADGLLAFWDEASRGTAHMIDCMRFTKKPVHVVRYRAEEDTTSTPNQGL